MRILSTLQFLILGFVLSNFISCKSDKESPEEIASKWCELNAQVYHAPSDAQKEKALGERTAFEHEMEDKYMKDPDMMQAIYKAVEACEAASEDYSNTSENTEGSADILQLAYADAQTAAKAYCSLIDKSIAASKSSSDEELQSIVSEKIMFENKLDESIQGNDARRDSIFPLIEPCMKKELEFRSQ